MQEFIIERSRLHRTIERVNRIIVIYYYWSFSNEYGGRPYYYLRLASATYDYYSVKTTHTSRSMSLWEISANILKNSTSFMIRLMGHTLLGCGFYMPYWKWEDATMSYHHSIFFVNVLPSLIFRWVNSWVESGHLGIKLFLLCLFVVVSFGFPNVILSPRL